MSNVRAAKWLVEFDNGESRFFATRNGRSFGYYDTIDGAISSIKKSRKYVDGDSIKATDEHGNRVPVRA